MNEKFFWSAGLLIVLASLLGVSAADYPAASSNATCRIDVGSCGNVSYDFTPGPSYGKEHAPGCICITFFYSPTCEHCHKVDAMLGELSVRFPQITVTQYNAAESNNAELKEAFDILYGVPQEKRAYVPAVYVGDYYFVGEEEAAGLEDAVRKYLETGSPCACDKVSDARSQSKESIIDRFKSFSALTVVFAGLVDSINPCAFAGIIFFMSYLAVTGRKGKDILIIGGLYSAGVFTAYMSLGLGFTRFITLAEESTIISRLIYPVTGLVALIFAGYSFLDYRKAKAGNAKDMTLQLPKRIKALTHTMIRKFARFRYLVFAAFFLGFIISLFEFLCTGQVYLPTIIYIMGVPELKDQATMYLLLYNLLFIAPLVAIFLATYYGTTSTQLQKVFSKNVSAIKLLTAVFFTVLGLYLLYSSARLFGI
ncbi:MAG: cytochrome c biogenesis protein CcdA [Candidatus Altiarchaeia archaeon]